MGSPLGIVKLSTKPSKNPICNLNQRYSSCILMNKKEDKELEMPVPANDQWHIYCNERMGQSHISPQQSRKMRGFRFVHVSIQMSKQNQYFWDSLLSKNFASDPIPNHCLLTLIWHCRSLALVLLFQSDKVSKRGLVYWITVFWCCV